MNIGESSSPSLPSCIDLPVREISSQGDLDQFHQSSTFNNFYTFIQELAEAVKGKKISDLSPNKYSKKVKWADDLIKNMTEMVQNFPPLATNSRFGNPAFQSWLNWARINIPKGHEDAEIPLHIEVASYLLNSLGDYQRIDYGTGHESHFAAWLYCLCSPRTGPFFATSDYPALVLVVFARYMQLMRALQSTYWLEPAGSHGVWGLDDYHFLPFLWGAAQLIDHPHIRPKSIHEKDLVEEYSSEYLYLNCIHNLNQIKKTGLRWHSPMLDDISAVKSWGKVLQGLLKMYKAEVLGKVPIMQHFLFGKILPFKSTAPKIVTNHRHSIRGDCCGNPLPSIYATVGDDKKNPCNHRPLTKLPFD